MRVEARADLEGPLLTDPGALDRGIRRGLEAVGAAWTGDVRGQLRPGHGYLTGALSRSVGSEFSPSGSLELSIGVGYASAVEARYHMAERATEGLDVAPIEGAVAEALGG